MEKLQLCLIVLLALGTISRCDEVGGPHFDSVEVLSSSLTPPLGCGPPKTVNVRFNEIKVFGNGSTVVYRRVTVTDLHLQFAMNASVSLPADSSVGCAKAAARAGLEAFVFKENCNGYRLNYPFVKCHWGDLVVFVRADSFAEETAVVPFDEAPYRVIKSADGPYRLYMLSAFVEADDDHPRFRKIEEFDENAVAKKAANVVFLENRDIIQFYRTLLDVNFCFNDVTHGLPIAVSYQLNGLTWPIVYFFQECGKKVEVTVTNDYISMLVLSHPGFGCKYYPTDLPDECTVIFETNEDAKMRHGFYFPEINSDDSGLIMTIAATKTNTGDTITVDMYQSNTFELINYCNTFNVSLQRQPSKHAIGFSIEILHPLLS